MTQLDDLIAVAHQLRAPGGCPWDAEQTHNSLTKYLLEETYELIDAIESGDRDEVIEELGDVLYQVIFHSDLGSTGTLGEPFDIEDVARDIVHGIAAGRSVVYTPGIWRIIMWVVMHLPKFIFNKLSI